MTAARRADQAWPRPVGQPDDYTGPDPTELHLVGALLHAPTAWVLDALTHLTGDDLGDPYFAEITEVIRELAAAGPAGPVLVKDRLLARGALGGNRGAALHRRFLAAITCGVDWTALHQLVTAVVSRSYRRRFDALHDGLEGLTGQSESVLRPYVQEHLAAIIAHEHRLAALRGPSGLL